MRLLYVGMLKGMGPRMWAWWDLSIASSITSRWVLSDAGFVEVGQLRGGAEGRCPAHCLREHGRDYDFLVAGRAACLGQGRAVRRPPTFPGQGRAWHPGRTAAVLLHDRVHIRLPQSTGAPASFLLLNKHHITKTAAQPIVDEFAGDRNVVLWRRHTSWNSVELMVWILKDLRQRLRPLEPHAQLVLLLDCAPCHAHPRVVHAAARNKIILVFLAASMTASLQPLDVFVVSPLKKYIMDAFERVVLEAEGQLELQCFKRSTDGWTADIAAEK